VTVFTWLQPVIFLVVLLLLVKPLGSYMARVYQGEATFVDRAFRPVEKLIYRLSGVRPQDEMDWKVYTFSLLLFNLVGLIFLYILMRLQGLLPLNPESMGAISPDLSFNTAVSFVTNTNWQSYSGETTMGYLVQMLGFTVQNFLSAATGIAVLIALIRGFQRNSGNTIGNFWVDLVRGTIYILLPLAIIFSIILVSQGVVQTFSPSQTVPLLDSTPGNSQQTIATGPAAFQVAIKQLGTNGGGFFNANSAHPFENPTPLTNFLEMLSILIIPASLCYTFGKMTGDTRRGWAILAAMTVIFIALLAPTIWAEQRGNPVLTSLGADQAASAISPGGNMEGKELRFGITNSALWGIGTTAASNGSVNAMLDSFTPLGGMLPMWMIQFGEVVYGGVGSGLYGMLAFVIIAVFVAGLMVGRTPEYLGKKIEAFEMKMASLMVLIPPLLVLAGTALAVLITAATSSVLNSGPHGFSEILYAFSSAANNNGSAFAGLAANNTFYNILLGLAMLGGRYLLIIAALAISGSLVRKKITPPTLGTLPTHTPLFVFWLIAVVILVGALSFLPALSLGPIVEHLMLR
jgi:K+-transporting ATPase ATPase A chain